MAEVTATDQPQISANASWQRAGTLFEQLINIQTLTVANSSYSGVLEPAMLEIFQGHPSNAIVDPQTQAFLGDRIYGAIEMAQESVRSLRAPLVDNVVPLQQAQEELSILNTIRDTYNSAAPAEMHIPSDTHTFLLKNAQSLARSNPEDPQGAVHELLASINTGTLAGPPNHLPPETLNGFDQSINFNLAFAQRQLAFAQDPNAPPEAAAIVPELEQQVEIAQTVQQAYSSFEPAEPSVNSGAPGFRDESESVTPQPGQEPVITPPAEAAGEPAITQTDLPPADAADTGAPTEAPAAPASDAACTTDEPLLQPKAGRPAAPTGDAVTNIELFMHFAKQGGWDPLDCVEVSGIDGIGDPMTARAMKISTGHSYDEMWNMTPEQIVQELQTKMNNDPEFRASVYKGLCDEGHEAYVRDFLTNQGVEVGDDVAAALDQYAASIGVNDGPATGATIDLTNTYNSVAPPSVAAQAAYAQNGAGAGNPAAAAPATADPANTVSPDVAAQAAYAQNGAGAGQPATAPDEQPETEADQCTAGPTAEETGIARQDIVNARLNGCSPGG